MLAPYLRTAAAVIGLSLIAACTAPIEQADEDSESLTADQEAELASDEESFDAYDASNDDLEKAAPVGATPLASKKITARLDVAKPRCPVMPALVGTAVA